MQLVGQCFCIGPLIDIALFLGIVASLAGAVGPLAVLVDFTATCIGFTVAALRGIFALARAGHLPAWLAATNRRGAPGNAAALVLVCALLVVAGGLLVPSDARFQTLFVAATAQALLLVLVYTALAVGALRLMA